MMLDHTSSSAGGMTGHPPPRGVVSVAPLVQLGEAVDISRLFERPAVPEPEAPLPALPVSVDPSAGGFLAELEREASSRQADSGPDPEAVGRNLRLANAACRAATDYWTRLAEHLNVLKPAGPGRYVFDGRNVLEGAPVQAFRVVPKLRVAHNGDEHFESVTLGWRVGIGKRVRVTKEFPAEIERLKARLLFAGITAFESQARHPETGRPQGTQFEFTADIIASVRLTPLHEDGKVRLSFHNVDTLERIEAEWPAFAIRATELDELARWICGKPHTLLKHAQNVVRHEP
jgi:hypothetical protein